MTSLEILVCRFQPGEGPSRGLLRDCTSPINRLQHYLAIPGLTARVAQHHGLGHAMTAPLEARAADVDLRAPRPVRAQPQRHVAVTVLLALAVRNFYIMFRFLVKTTLDKSALGIVTAAEILDIRASNEG